MELVVSKYDFQTGVKPKEIEDYIKPEGLLNSNYKNIVKENYVYIEQDTVFGIRQRIKSFQYANTTSISIILKISVFILGYLLIIL